MGWARGSELAGVIEDALAPYLDRLTEAERMKLGDEIAEAFLRADCDTLWECEGFIGDAANRAEHGGAPKAPNVGDRYQGSWNVVYEWNGRQWRAVG